MITRKVLTNNVYSKIIKHQLNILPCRLISSVPLEAKETKTEPKVFSSSRKKPTKEPFVKNLFLGECDTDLLAYPEILENEQLSEMNQQLTPIQNYFHALDSVRMDMQRKLDSNIWNDIQELGVLEYSINGINENETARCKLQEIVANDCSISSMLAAQQNLGYLAFQLYGSQKQKDAYLEKLKHGEFVTAFCLIEPAHSDPAYLSSQAELDESEQFWVLNGEKRWVVNGKDPDIYIVFAQTKRLNHMSQIEDTITTFLVDSKSTGIKVLDANPLGIAASNLSTVQFSNVLIPKDNVLGEIDKGVQIAVSLLTSNRLYVGAESICVLTNCIKDVVKHVIEKGTSERKMTDLDWVKKIIAQAAVKTYAIESMTYFTAGLMDGYENQDTDLEKTIVKVFSSENCLSALEDCANLYGPDSYNKDHKINRWLRDCRRHVQLDESNNLLRHYIALIGLQYAGQDLADSVKKVRNPLYYPGYALRKMWQDRGQARDQPKLTLNLEYYFHPSLRTTAQLVEYSLHRLKFGTEALLSQYGIEVVHKHLELERLGNAAIDVYAMIAVIARASRAYCIGLQNAEYEILTASTFCIDAMARVKKNVAEICAGSYGVNDGNYLKLGEKTFTWKGYYAEHPTKRNF